MVFAIAAQNFTGWLERLAASTMQSCTDTATLLVQRVCTKLARNMLNEFGISVLWFDEDTFLYPPPSIDQDRVPQARYTSRDMPALTDVLQCVRPDWGRADLRQVQQKLAKIQVHNTWDLMDQWLVDETFENVNHRLREAGQKALKSETLHE